MSAVRQASAAETAVGYLALAISQARAQATYLSKAGNNERALEILAAIDGIDLEFRTARRLSPRTILPKLEELTLRAQEIGNAAMRARTMPIPIRAEQIVSWPELQKVQRHREPLADGKWWTTDKLFYVPVNAFQGVQP